MEISSPIGFDGDVPFVHGGTWSCFLRQRTFITRTHAFDTSRIHGDHFDVRARAHFCTWVGARFQWLGRPSSQRVDELGVNGVLLLDRFAVLC